MLNRSGGEKEKVRAGEGSAGSDGPRWYFPLWEPSGRAP